ncbi:MAG: hypothetical protein IJC20_04140 [Clostridia bacterium]|nr:hypothetical protein [Clostridia bacterium]
MERKRSVFSSKRILKQAIDEYFNVYLVETCEIADIESLADYLGVTRDEIMSMMNDKRFGSVLKIARNRIAKIKKQLAFNGKIPATVLAFDLKNNHGYRDKPDENDAVGSGETVIFKGKTAEWAK